MTMSVPEEKSTPSQEKKTLSPADQSLPPYEPIAYKLVLLPHKILVILLFHCIALYSVFYASDFKWQSQLYGNLESLCIALGILVGAHRLWAHRTFKATLALRLFLLFYFTMSFEDPVYDWVRNHRCHHKWTDTDADPYNARRGFFFSHVGWLCRTKHPEVISKGKAIDMSDIEGDALLAFQRRWYYPLLILIWGIWPVFVPVYFWGESAPLALLAIIYRTVLIHNITWLVNSWAHMYGNRPYDKKVSPVEATIRHLMLGEGFHNYHHAFPLDYSASELGPLEVFNPPTAFINLCHWMGWASHLKRADPSLIEKKVQAVGRKEYFYKGNFAKEWIGGLLTYLIAFSFAPLAISYTFKHIGLAIA